MSSISEFILNMMGKPDPRQQLAAMAAGGGQAAGGGATPGAVGTDPGTAAPGAPAAPPAEAAVYKSPSELMNLYMALQDRQQKSRSIDRGLGLFTASLAHPENRAGIMATMNASDGQSDPASLMSSVLGFQTKASELAAKTAQRASVPAIASKYGLDVTTAQYLFDTGKLDSVIAELEKPDKQLATDPNTGQSYIVDLNTGTTSEPMGTPKKREIEIVEGQNGEKFTVYKDDKSRVGGDPLVPGQPETTADQKNYEAYRLDQESRREPVKSFADWSADQRKSTVTNSNLGKSGIDYGSPPTDMAWKRDAEGNIELDQRGAPVAIPIAGSKSDLERQANEAEAAANVEKGAQKDSQKIIQGGVVGQEIDRVIKAIDDNKDTWLPITGIGGLLKGLPQTDARFLEQTLNTIKANVGFDKLQAMRDSSPTGAALGPVSDFENQLLQATFGSLDQLGDAEALKFNLRRIQKIVSLLPNTKITPENVGELLGDVGGAGYTPGESTTGGLEDLLKKYGG